MKKIFTFLFFIVLTFVFIGKVNAAAVGIVDQLDPTYSGSAHSKRNVKIKTTEAYSADSVLTVRFSKKYGVDHFVTDFTFDTTKFAVTEAYHQVGNYWEAKFKLLVDLPAGEYDFVDITIYDIPSAPDDSCVVYVTPVINETPKTCADSKPAQGIYYNDKGETIDADRYAYECEKHVCEPVTFTLNGTPETHYFNKDGNEVATKQEMIDSCDCQSDGMGAYYKWNDSQNKIDLIPQQEYEFLCEKRVCTSYEYNGETYYYDRTGNTVATAEEMNASCKCRYDEAEKKYYGPENTEITEEEFKKLCECRIDKEKDPKEYYCKKGEPCTEEEYKNQCPENSPTGSSIPYIAILGGVFVAGACYVISKKHTKIKNV